MVEVLDRDWSSSQTEVGFLKELYSFNSTIILDSVYNDEFRSHSQRQNQHLSSFLSVLSKATSLALSVGNRTKWRDKLILNNDAINFN